MELWKSFRGISKSIFDFLALSEGSTPLQFMEVFFAGARLTTCSSLPSSNSSSSGTEKLDSTISRCPRPSRRLMTFLVMFLTPFGFSAEREVTIGEGERFELVEETEGERTRREERRF